MFTLQILDAGQTFLHALTDRPVTVGSAPDAGIRLVESGVDPTHATIEPIEAGYRLRAVGEVRINGTPVVAAVLQLGDRIEFGCAVAVVGRTVARSARPEDVLTPPVRRAPRAERSAPSKRRAPLLPIGIGVAFVGAIVAFGVTRGTDTAVRDELAYVRHLRESARLEEARKSVVKLRRDWADASDDRLQRLAQEEAAIAAVDAARERLVARLLDPVIERTYAEWNRELQRLEQDGAADERVAAHLVRSRLRETLMDRPAPSVARPPESQDLASNNPVAQPGRDPDAQAEPAHSVVEQPQLTGPELERAEVERLCVAGDLAQALGLIQAGYEQAKDPQTVAEWQHLERQVEASARAAVAALTESLRESLARRDYEGAAAKLRSAARRLPPDLLAPLSAEIASARATPPSTPATPPTPATVVQVESPPVDDAAQPASGTPSPPSDADRIATLAGLRSKMDAVHAAEERGEFAAAVLLLREAADEVESRDADFARRLRGRAAESHLLAAWHAAVVAGVDGGKALRFTAADGEATLQVVEASSLVVVSPAGVRRLTWHEFDSVAIGSLSQRLGASGEALLGAASLLFRIGAKDSAERLLAGAVRKDAAVAAGLDAVLARGRGEPADDFGYELTTEGFVSRRRIEAERRAVPLQAKLASALRGEDRTARDAFLAATPREQALDREILVVALANEIRQRRAKLEEGPLHKQFDRMAAMRAKLDEARAHAKELIFDEARYFYPYKPPAVSADKFAEYNRVQKEVDDRVEAVSALWRDAKTKLRVPKSLAVDLETITWLVDQHNRYAREPVYLADLDWARALPPGATVTLQDFAVTSEERLMREEWSRVLAYDTALDKQLTPAQRELLAITNEYRMMFGHRPLAAVSSCMAASQGHADEMSQLGYFSHTSPTPGRTTPYDRMRLAGYEHGVSENIALTSGAMAAHVAWCHSSGHHRNLLMPTHTEMGIGANGRYWVQNFGGGDEHRRHPAYPAR